MALYHGVSFFLPLELQRHECRAECVEEADEVRLYLPCLACWGHGCERCHCVGFTALYSCPLARDLGDAWEYIELFKLYPDVLPLSLGIYEHPAPYVVAMRMLVKAKALIMDSLKKLTEQQQSNG